MTKFWMCEKIESWKLKTEILNLFVKCLKQFEILKIEMFKYWKLKCMNIKN